MVAAAKQTRKSDDSRHLKRVANFLDRAGFELDCLPFRWRKGFACRVLAHPVKRPENVGPLDATIGEPDAILVVAVEFAPDNGNRLRLVDLSILDQQKYL
ncbi:MAG: hypothetical protein EBZ69_02525 [Alphaproteobacteria bacterium]|nr:hypothetical protein [Alphaproteobacteria bacterium]